MDDLNISVKELFGFFIGFLIVFLITLAAPVMLFIQIGWFQALLHLVFDTVWVFAGLSAYIIYKKYIKKKSEEK